MKNHPKTRWLSMLLAFLLVLSCTAPVQAEQAEQAESTGAHSIVERTFPFYIGKTADDTLDQEFPLYFIDGVDDLPYVELADWAKLMYFLNTDINGDFRQAICLFENALDILTDDDVTFRIEGIAWYYMMFAIVLKEDGQKERALEACDVALSACDEDFSGIIEALRDEIEALEG